MTPPKARGLWKPVTGVQGLLAPGGVGRGGAPASREAISIRLFRYGPYGKSLQRKTQQLQSLIGLLEPVMKEGLQCRARGRLLFGGILLEGRRPPILGMM